MKRVTLSKPRSSPPVGTGGKDIYKYIRSSPLPSVPVPASKKVKVVKKAAVDLDSLLEQAALLKPADRKQLLAHLALAAHDEEIRPSRDLDMWATAVYTGLTRAIGHGEGAGQGPALIKRVVGARAAWAPVQDFMVSSKLDQLQVTERRAVYDFLAVLVIARAKSVSNHVGAPLGPKLVANTAPSIAAIFDAEFPGYLASGLVRIVARRIISGYKPPVPYEELGAKGRND